MEYLERAKGQYRYQILLQTIKEKDTYIVYSHSLDLSAYGNSINEAKKNFNSTLQIFLRETSKKGTLDEVLSELGWEKTEVAPEPRWIPPLVINTNDVEEGCIKA